MSSLPINLSDLLHRRTVEGERIEYKAGWNPDPIIRTLCAFANDFANLGGGYIVIGQDCDANGQPIFPPVGLQSNQLDRIQRELLQLCHSIQPAYSPILSVEELEGRHLIVLWAPGGENRPYKAPKEVTARNRDYRYFIRRYSSTVEAQDDDERELMSLASRVPYDDRFNQSARLADLSRPLIEAFLKEVKSDLAKDAPGLAIDALGRQMNIVGGSPEGPFPKNVGLLFFNDEPGRFFPATQIDVVWFPEGPAGDTFEEKTFAGPLSRMTREALDYIQRNYLKEIVRKVPDRAQAQRVWNFPFAAIEEAVVNAVYHRSYEEREPIEVRITPQELTVLSYPGPDRSINLDDLRAGRAVSRRYRNRRIGEFLKELDLTEGRATGIPKILRAMQENGSPAPQFESDENRTSFLIRLPAHPESAELAPEAARLPAQVLSLVSHLAGEMTRAELMEVLDLQDRMHFSKAYLGPALGAGLVEMTMPEKPKSKLQKYRLTALGRRLAGKVE